MHKSVPTDGAVFVLKKNTDLIFFVRYKSSGRCFNSPQRSICGVILKEVQLRAAFALLSPLRTTSRGVESIESHCTSVSSTDPTLGSWTGGVEEEVNA